MSSLKQAIVEATVAKNPTFLHFKFDSDWTSDIRQTPATLAKLKEALFESGGSLLHATFSDAWFSVPEGQKCDVTIGEHVVRGTIVTREQVVEQLSGMDALVTDPPESDMTGIEVTEQDLGNLRIVKDGGTVAREDLDWLAEAGLVEIKAGGATVTAAGLGMLD
jgi:hypothetical protein